MYQYPQQDPSGPSILCSRLLGLPRSTLPCRACPPPMVPLSRLCTLWLLKLALVLGLLASVTAVVLVSLLLSSDTLASSLLPPSLFPPLRSLFLSVLSLHPRSFPSSPSTVSIDRASSIRPSNIYHRADPHISTSPFQRPHPFGVCNISFLIRTTLLIPISAYPSAHPPPSSACVYRTFTSPQTLRLPSAPLPCPQHRDS